MIENRNQKLIVSLTSYPARIGRVEVVLESLLLQTVKPDRIVLCLSRENFPHEESDLPDSLKRVLAKGVELLWCEDDLKPHKKYFYTMQKYPEATVITVDDDWVYPQTLVEELVSAHERFPTCICTRWSRLMVFGEDGNPMPYCGWPHGNEFFANVPLLPILPLTGSGTLYPPCIVPSEAFDISALEDCALCQDDLWLRLMTLARGVPVVTTGATCELTPLETDECLMAENKVANDEALIRTAEHVRSKMGIDVLALARNASCDWTGDRGRRLLQAYSQKIISGKKNKEKLAKAQKERTKTRERLAKAQAKLAKLQDALTVEREKRRSLKKSYSYRLGRLLTWPLRVLRNGGRR